MLLRLLSLVVVVAGLSAQAFGQAEERFIPVYKTNKVPNIDGTVDPGEWDNAGPLLFVNQDSPNVGFGAGVIADDVYSGDEDLSFSFRAMWAEPWMLYVVVEITDDIAMDDDPTNLWERDQVELFMDGDDLFGSDDDASFQWWESNEPFGKFGTSRYATYEGNPARMTLEQDDIFVDDEFSFVNVAAVGDETGEGGNYVVEYAISIEPMYLLGTFDDDSVTSEAGQIVEDNTVTKLQICVSDDDNFVSDDGATERSNTLCYLDTDDWRRTSQFADLTFVGEFTGTEPGDFDGNGTLDSADIDDLTVQSASGLNPSRYDLDGDSLVNDADVAVWIKDHYNSWVGDANLDGEFNTADLVTVLASGTYEVDVDSVWSTGDFNGDGRTNTSDLVSALSDGGYEAGPRAAVAAVPEPTGATLLLLGSLVLVSRRR